MATHDCGEHCPFLNRSDRRCSSFLSLDRIAHAFDHCFGEYKTCPVYLELLVERRVRRLCGLLSPAEQGSEQTDGQHRRPAVQLTVGQSHAAPGGTAHRASHAAGHGGTYDGTFNGPVGPHAHRYPQHAATSQGIPAAPRF